MGDEDETATRDGAPSVTGYRVSRAITQTPREARYRRGAEIARGGLGRITEAYDQTLQRQVAIKELHHRTEQGRQRFELESLTTARLQHPAIVSVFDSGTWESGEPFLVLQLLEGTTLSEEIAKRPTLDARLALIPNLLAIADALGYAHEQGVVHRDVKPSNIMLGKHGATVILDWGVAHDSARSLSIDQEVLVGTPRFMSPEQARGESPVPAFDVFSLGVTIATLLNGRQPFADQSADDIVGLLRNGTTDIPVLPPEVPGDLASIVAKATAPDTRYANAAEVASDLRRFIAGQLVSSRRYTKSELFVRWLRRNRVLIAAAAAVIVIGAIAVGSVIHERNAAVVERERALARAHEMVLLEARTRLGVDPTATIAWLKEYPASAPHQEQLLALVDEAADRGVAKHVWNTPEPIADAELTDDALIVATYDGAITRIDAATGVRSRLAKLPSPPFEVRARANGIAVLDRTGGVWRVENGLVRVATVDTAGELSSLHMLPDGALKVTYLNDDAMWVGGPKEHHPDLVFVEDEIDSRLVYGFTATGELHVGNPTTAKVWQFPPQTWLRASNDGSHYLVIAPEPDRSVTLWLGAVDKPPVQFARSRACAAGEDGAQDAELTNDGRIASLVRCGVLNVWDTAAGRTLPVPDAERVTYNTLSPDGRWLAIGHVNGFDLIELATGASRRVDPQSTIVRLGFSPDGRSIFSVSEQGIRMWPVQSTMAIAGRLGEVGSTVNLSASGDNGLLIRRHLDCSIWSTRERRVIASANIAALDARDPDDEDTMWPQSASRDGRTCLFASRNDSVIVVGMDGAKHTITEPSEVCLLSDDGRTATCFHDDVLFSADVATERVVSSRHVDGVVTALVLLRGQLLALVRGASKCTIETFEGKLFATLRSHECTYAHSIGKDMILVGYTGDTTTVWTEHGMFDLPVNMGNVYPSPSGDRAATVKGDRITLWDLRANATLPGPPPHERAISAAAWASNGILASSDDEIIQLWDPTTNRTRVVFAPHMSSLTWSRDGSTLFASDGRIVQAWPIDLARGASTAAVRARLDELTTTQIIDGHAGTPSTYNQRE